VFKRYHNHPKDTAKEFTKDKWYRPNDMVEFVPSDGKDGYDGAYRILGNLNVDLIKTGGFRVSAQDVERVLLEHESIGEIAIIGVEDMTYGQKVAAVVSWAEGAPAVELSDIREWAKEKLPSYSVPTLLKVLDKLPRNVMGKVNKKEIAKVAFPSEADTKTAAA
jgi:malonyl-CoA/methylmalonyl-CoA synthetase